MSRPKRSIRGLEEDDIVSVSFFLFTLAVKHDDLSVQDTVLDLELGGISPIFSGHPSVFVIIEPEIEVRVRVEDPGGPEVGEDAARDRPGHLWLPHILTERRISRKSSFLAWMSFCSLERVHRSSPRSKAFPDENNRDVVNKDRKSFVMIMARPRRQHEN